MAVRNKVKNTNSDVPLVWLVHPGAGESKREAELNALGYRVLTGPWNSREIARKKAKPPCAVVVDLSRVLLRAAISRWRCDRIATRESAFHPR